MPTIQINGARLYYKEHGVGPGTIVFAHALLFSGEMFRRQVQALSADYRCLTFDFRGQGQSEVTRDGYDMNSLTEDAAALIEGLGCIPCHFVGHSMGSFVAMRLALRRPEWIKSLVLMAASADPQPRREVIQYWFMSLLARQFGIGLVVNQLMPIVFGRKFLDDPARASLREDWRRRLIANHPIGAARAVRGVITRPGLVSELDQITVPTLIIAGEQDRAAPPARGLQIQAHISGSTFVGVPQAGHLFTVEQPEAVNSTLAGFFGRVQDRQCRR
jgi:pimeloyl-ACP methyl ester carboxylesterase